MARLKFGAIITDSRGAIGGQQIKGTAFGTVLMTRGNPTNRRTTLQQNNRASVGEISAAWTRDLSDSERIDWTALGATQTHTDTWGTTYPLGGATLFTRLNVKRLAAGLSMLTTAPSDQVVTSPLTATGSISAGPTLEVAYTTAPSPTNHRVRIYGARQQSAGTSTAQARYKLLKISAASPSSPIDITAEYETAFGPIIAGRKIFIQLSFWNSVNSAESERLDTDVIA